MSKRRFDWSTLQNRSARVRSHPAGTGPRSERRSDPQEHNDTGAGRLGDGRSAPSAPAGESSGRDPNAIEIRVNDLKQFAYCPRIVFYQYTMPVERRATFKMEHGKAVEPRVEDLEKRRKLRQYGLAEGTRRFQVSMHSRRLGMSGRVDLLVETKDGMFPVDFKDTNAAIRHNHRIQLCAYAILIEDALQRPVPAGFIYRVPRNDVTVVEMSPALRAETLSTIAAIRTLIAAERIPDATSVRGRCADCEYRNYCGDVF